MPFAQLLVLAVVAMLALVALRLIRIHFGRTPLPEGRGRRLFLLGFVLVPPLVLGALAVPGTASGPFRGASTVPVYVVIVAGIVVLMWIAAVLVAQLDNLGKGASGAAVQNLRLILDLDAAPS